MPNEPRRESSRRRERDAVTSLVAIFVAPGSGGAGWPSSTIIRGVGASSQERTIGGPDYGHPAERASAADCCRGRNFLLGIGSAVVGSASGGLGFGGLGFGGLGFARLGGNAVWAAAASLAAAYMGAECVVIGGDVKLIAPLGGVS